MPTSPTFPTLDGGPREPDTNQPSPVLTAEEREEGNQHVKNLRTWARTHPWLETPASWIVRVLSRTADPDTVTLPREVVKSLAEFVVWATTQARHDIDSLADLELDPIERESLAVAEQAIAIPQAQGGDDE